MNLIKIETREDGQQVVSGRELHEFLQIGTEYRKWFPRMCEYGFTENVDFIRVYQKCLTLGGEQEIVNHKLTVSMAKELAMLARNEQGKKARQYFIQVETAWNTPEQVMARALQLAQKTINNFQVQIETMKPKVEFYDEIVSSTDTIDIAELAKTLNIKGIGRNKLFEFLRAEKILNGKNIPYQTYVDRGYFRTIETTYNKGGIIKIHIKTVVFQKGVDFVRRLLKSK